MMILFTFLLLLALVMFAIAAGVIVARRGERKRIRQFLSQLDESPKPRVTPEAKPQMVRPQTKAVDRRLTLTAALTIAGALAGILLRNTIPEPAGSVILAAIGGALPGVRERRRKKAQVKAFEAQFPDALEFLSRSMLAGHGFTSSLNLLVEESPDPLASVFRAAANEIRLGAPLETALAKLPEQIPLVDVRFFVSAVLLQQSSGGNLAEVLNKLAYVVRERFRLAGEVRAASAHGRLTSIILIALPIFLTIALLVLDPEYLTSFVHEPEGRVLLTAAVFGQVAGQFFIRRIVNIKV